MQSLITQLSKGTQAGGRLAAVRGLLVWGKMDRWGQPWMLDVLCDLRNDDDAHVSAAAFASFSFVE